jgi:hypothetical protein
MVNSSTIGADILRRRAERAEAARAGAAETAFLVLDTRSRWPSACSGWAPTSRRRR